MNASYREGWLEWKTNAHGKRACRIRYWTRDESRPNGWRKAAKPWETGLTKKQANRKLRDWMQQMDQAQEPIPETKTMAQSLTLAEFCTGMWPMNRRNQGIKRSTNDGHESILKKHVLPELGSRVLDRVTPADLTLFFDKLANKGLSAKTQVNIYQFLHAMFEVALEHDLIKSNPVRKKLHRPKYKHQKLAIWTPEQVARVLKEIPAHWSAFFWCLALTTVRIGEILALQRRDVDLKDRKIRFGKNLWRGQIQMSTKTGEVYDKHITDRLVLELEGHLKDKNLQADDFVFQRSLYDRRPLDPDYIRREVLYPALQRAGIEKVPFASGFHAFRRAMGKHLRKAAGLELASIQLSHKHMSTTDDHYNDKDGDDIVRAAQLVEATLSEFCPRT